MSKKVACILLIAACTGSGDDRDTTERESTKPAPASEHPATPSANEAVAPAPTAPAAAPVAPAPSVPPPTVSTTTPASSITSAWRDRVKADVSALRTSSPAVLTELSSLAPSRTRAGLLRFTTDAIHDPRAAAVFIDRLARGGDSEEVRAALVEALPRTGGSYADAAVELFATERSSLVRSAYLFAARRAPSTEAIALMRRGLSDSNADVQAEAARTAASHTDGKRLGGELRALLASTSPAVRAEGARTLGILKITEARGELAAAISDSSADVRLEALRAIERIDPGAARTLPLAKLAKDEDPRIVALVTRLTAPPLAPGMRK